ncbi:hypothetical protein VP01_3222g2 [Puccinia sorghi]|uniref:Uncharacterized protein n=1 Tax=Puccinia sorghi TaxID=27349 RepID=A0A0L6V055_9BASI|nr:hypothetical protein VP01_3222g2 [Puccinia sorghi]
MNSQPAIVADSQAEHFILYFWNETTKAQNLNRMRNPHVRMATREIKTKPNEERVGVDVVPTCLEAQEDARTRALLMMIARVLRLKGASRLTLPRETSIMSRVLVRNQKRAASLLPETEGQEHFDDDRAAKNSRRKGSSSDKQAEPSSGKGPAKRQPYVRQVDLPREKLSPADLEAKMAAMALKNAQLMEQKKAADQDAAEYREIELKSQRTVCERIEAQRAQQQEIDAARKAVADRKLKKMQGREWDLEKTEDDWNRSRPYTDSMTNANPGRNSWNSHRGSGHRGRSARGHHPQGRGTGRGGRRGPGGAEGDRSLPHDSAQGQELTSNGNDATPST